MNSNSPPNRTDIPIYSPYKDVPVNGSHSLYDGELQLNANNVQAITPGNIDFVLSGSPRVNFDVKHLKKFGWLLQEGDLSVPPFDNCLPAPVQFTKVHYDSLEGEGAASGVLKAEGLKQRILNEKGKTANVNRIRFHLINFRSYNGTSLSSIHEDRIHEWTGRVTFTFGKWTVTLDEFRDTSKKLEEAAILNGHVFTHVGILYRSDGKLFDPDCTQSVREALHWFLSFINGGRCALALPSGLRHLSYPLWQQWNVDIASTVQSGKNWFSKAATQQCFSAGDKFYHCWSNPAKREWLKSALGLYLASNRYYGGIELTLALSQVTLEMLTWVALLEENSLMSLEQFDKLPAADKIRILLFWLGIKTDIPPKCTDLKFAYSTFDAPHAVVDIRNAVIHQTKANRSKRGSISNDAIYEAWQLNQWYSEITLLKLIGYSGAYNNRIDNPPMSNSLIRMWDMLPWTPTTP